MSDSSIENGINDNQQPQQQQQELIKTILEKTTSLSNLIMDFCCNNNDQSLSLSSTMIWTTVIISIIMLMFYVAKNILFKINKCQNKIDNLINDTIINSINNQNQNDENNNNNNLINNENENKQQQQQFSKDKFFESHEWINELIKWFQYKSKNDNNFIQKIANEWLNTLNIQSSKLINENGIYIEFLQIEQINNSKLNQINKTVEELNDNLITTINATCDRLILQVRVAPDQYCDINRTAIYHVILEKFSSLLKIVAIIDELLFVIRPLERPETRAQINGPLLGSKNKFQHDLIINAILNIFTSTIFDLNFLNILQYDENFPKLLRNQNNNNNNNIVGLSKNNYNDNNDIKRELLIKISKVIDLKFYNNNNDNDDENKNSAIYCQIELDEPFQTKRTTIIRNKLDCLEWDQHFMFNLNEKSYELLFELFDEKKPKLNDNEHIGGDKILGNAIVNINELSMNPSQSQILRLQSSKNNQHDIGNLIVEFLLMEHRIQRFEQPQQQQQNQVKQKSSKNNDNHDESVNNLSAIQQQQQQQQQQQSVQEDPGYNSGETSQLQLDEEKIQQQQKQRQLEKSSTLSSKNNSDLRIRDKPSLLRNIKKTFSFNNRRSKSYDKYIGKKYKDDNDLYDEDDYFNSNNNLDKRAKSVPRELSNHNNNINDGINKIKTKNKDSFGNLSQQSTNTFIHEDSIIIVERIENNNKVYYQLPFMDEDKIRLYAKFYKGKKFHLFKQHLFYAKRASSSKRCPICSEKFAFKFRKQAYECRECGLLCHKQCHIDVKTHCSLSKINELNIITVDPNNNNNNIINQLNYYNNNNNNNVPEITLTDTTDIDNINDNQNRL